MAIHLDEENLKDGLLGLVVALVEIIQELLDAQPPGDHLVELLRGPVFFGHSLT